MLFSLSRHGLLSNVTYQTLSGTSVLLDFVELPSQLYEHWLSETEVLKQHVRSNIDRNHKCCSIGNYWFRSGDKHSLWRAHSGPTARTHDCCTTVKSGFDFVFDVVAFISFNIKLIRFKRASILLNTRLQRFWI